MNRQDFTEKMGKYFLPHQAEKFADYAEKLHSVIKCGALRSMTGFDYLCIRMAEEASKGIMWLMQYAADILGEIEVLDNMPDFDKLMDDIEAEW